MLLRNSSDLVDPTGRPLETIGLMSYPAAGKGTLVNGMGKELGARGETLVSFGVGDMVMDEIKRGTDWGKEADSYRSKGVMVPKELILEKIKERVFALHTDNKEAVLKVLDGVPRNEEQIDPFEQYMDELETEYQTVFIDVTREAAEERMIRRGEKAIAAGEKPRSEDIDKGVRKTRLDVAQRDMQILVEHFDRIGKLIVIDGMNSIAGVQEEAREKILSRVLLPAVERENRTDRTVSTDDYSNVAAPSHI